MIKKEITMTEEEFLEFRKATSDCEYWINKFAYTQNRVIGHMRFLLWPFQKAALKLLVDDGSTIALKPRQMGVSWLTAAYILWFAMYNYDKAIQIISIGDREAKKFLDKCKYIYKYLPDYLKVPIVNGKPGAFGDKSKMEFKNNSFIESLPASENAGRSESLSILVMDEAAFIQNADKIWSAAQPTLSTGGKSIIISTANGVGNLYHRLYTDAVSNQVDLKVIELDWRQHPDRWDVEKEAEMLAEWGLEKRSDLDKLSLPRDMKLKYAKQLHNHCQKKDFIGRPWYDAMAKKLGPRLTAQEIDCDFLTSGDNVFPMKLIHEMLREGQFEPLAERYNGRLIIHEKPIKGRKYVLGGDVASGHGKDFSAFSIMDKHGNEVCEFKGRVSTGKYADIIYQFAKYYNNALVGVEINGLGISIIDQLQRMNYKRIYFRQSMVKDDQGKRRKSKLPGWETTGKNRPVIIDQLVEAISSGDYVPKSRNFLLETYTFIWNGSKPEAMEGTNDEGLPYNDDTILCRAIAWRLRSDPQMYRNLPLFAS